MPEANEVLKGVLSTLYKQDDEGVASLFKEDGALVDDAFDRIKALDETRVTTLRNGVEDAKKEQFKYGERKANEKWENAIKGHGVKSDKQGPQLLDELIAAKASKTEITDDIVKTLPIYRDLETKTTQLTETFEQRLADALKAKDTEIQRGRTLEEVRDYATSIVAEMRPVGLPKDPTKAKAFLSPLFAKIEAYEYQVQGDSGKRTFLPIKPDGSRLEDSHAHQMPFDALVKQTANQIWEFEQGEERSNMGDPNKGASKQIAGDVPTDPDKLAQFLYDLQRDPSVTPEKRNAVLKEIKARG